MAGLTNKSRTMCYANGAFKAILSAPEVINFLNGVPHCDNHLMAEVLSLVNAPHDGRARSINLLHSKLLEAVPSAKELKNTTQQQDGGEWLLHFIEAISNSLKSPFSEEWNNLFTRTTIDSFQCAQSHNWVSTLTDQSKILMLPTVDDRGNALKTLQNSLNRYMQAEEVLVGCESDCAEKFAKKTTKVTREPKVLIVQLNRFNNAAEKMDHAVHVPIELMVQEGGAKYQLVGSLVHNGKTLQSGHYHTVTVDVSTKTAFICNDEVVKAVDATMLDRELYGSYILVYRCTESPSQQDLTKREELNAEKNEIEEVEVKRDTKETVEVVKEALACGSKEGEMDKVKMKKRQEEGSGSGCGLYWGEEVHACKKDTEAMEAMDASTAEKFVPMQEPASMQELKPDECKMWRKRQGKRHKYVAEPEEIAEPVLENSQQVGLTLSWKLKRVLGDHTCYATVLLSPLCRFWELNQ